MMFAWREYMSVGNAKIDNDHKYLISIINTIEAAINCEASNQALSAYVSQLFDYSYKHFQREEQYQDEIMFPDREAHKKEHKDLMEQIKQIHENLKSHEDTKAYRFITPGLVRILKDWLMNHFTQEDIKMREYFKALK